MTVVGLLLLFLVLMAGFFYWLLVTTEGAYLGPRAVAFLYDRGAGSYDSVKAFDAVDDAWDLAQPLKRALDGVGRPLILDVGTGTGRLPLALLRDLDFEGCMVGLDLSLKMLKEARRKTAGREDQVMLVWKDALALPFLDNSFDAVSCVEALEFMANPRAVVEEMARVLRPGGTLLATNRIGLDALLMPGRTFSHGQLRRLVSSLGFTSVEIKTWQTYYDLVWARKGGQLSPREGQPSFEEVLCCPRCWELPLRAEPAGLSCDRCSIRYPVDKGIIYLERPVTK
ncbi:MAG: methyltransferase domain-containing protein [Anaerolineae bacterium]|nr:methyltransferase domain-containing protein [Anaerolineae bacterium]NIN99851.1 methyltransferase domain-containing protein [Anaerolineae bacterium]NIQ82626.1 methyltransferase domain-containing protein [Anaerolineae bacterium]